MHRCLPCLEKESVSLRLDGGYPPAAPCSNSVLGPIRHDMQEYYDLRQGSITELNGPHFLEFEKLRI
jgi:hypothetical protein